MDCPSWSEQLTDYVRDRLNILRLIVAVVIDHLNWPAGLAVWLNVVTGCDYWRWLKADLSGKLGNGQLLEWGLDWFEFGCVKMDCKWFQWKVTNALSKEPTKVDLWRKALPILFGFLLREAQMDSAVLFGWQPKRSNFWFKKFWRSDEKFLVWLNRSFSSKNSTQFVAVHFIL